MCRKQPGIAIGREGVLSVEGLEFLMLITAKSTQQEKDRDGCPKIVNLGSAKTDLFYERKKHGFKKR
ncbi:hypothetical protein ACFX19_033492 [Malus domestica]